MHSFIKATSYFLPEKEFSNEDYVQIFPETKEQTNLEKIGIKSRRIVNRNVTASDLAVEAAKKLFTEHGISPHNIDFILFCAQEFDYYTPTTACVIQDRLNIPTATGALDFNLGCSGFGYGLSLAKGLIESCKVRNVLLLTSSTLTKTFHPKDKSSRFVFGDGAAATLISSREKNWGIGEFVFGTDGKGYKKIIVEDGGARNELTEKSHIDKIDEFGNVTNASTFYMEGTGVFIFSIKAVPKMVSELLEKNRMSLDEIDLFIFHQANKFMLETIQKKLNIPEDKFFIFMENCGNTVSSTIPIALYEAMKAGRAKKGDKILIAGFGVGLSWAGTVIKL